MRYSTLMSGQWTRRVLWGVLLLTLPVPFYFLGTGWAPSLALLEISAYLLPVWLTEGGPGVRLALSTIGLQGLFWAGVLYVLARFMSSLLTRLGNGRAPLAGVGIVVACLVFLSLFDVYLSPVIARGAPVNLFGVY